MTFVVQIVYAALCVYFAKYNAVEIKSDRRIYHGINGAIHLAVVSYTYFKMGGFQAFSMLLVARLFFDIPLNLFRGIPLDYVPDNPKSIVDRIEKFVFGEDGVTPKLIYLDLLLIINFFL